MNQNLSDITTDIIKNSIASAIYIDDSIIEPFSSHTKEDEGKLQFSTEIFNSFRKESKSLDFYRYLINKNWQDHSDYLFKNRDLLILDWQLQENGNSQNETLRILKKAVKRNNLHFVAIYTYTETRDFPNIFYSIKAFFNNAFEADSYYKCEKLVETLDNEGIDTNFISEIGDKLKEYSLQSPSSNKEILDQAKEIVKAKMGGKVSLFFKELRKINVEPNKACEILGYYINKEAFVETDNHPFEINLEYINDNFLVINNTIIQITNKQAPKPDELFQFFTSALSKVCANLLTLTNIEIKNLLRESSAFLDKDINNIKNATLFHQRKKKENFLEFLIGILKNQTLSLFDYSQDSIKTMQVDFWEKYYTENQIESEIKNLEENQDLLHDQLANLNIYYNELSIRKKDFSILKFGDLFANMVSEDKGDNTFYLCITAHCDCLNPTENIKNNFFFIRGEARPSIKDAISEGDGNYNSFIRFNSKVISIKWNSKPVILRIDNNKLHNFQIFGFDGLEKKYTLKYVTTLKESYTQRMANNSFSFAMRVGINFSTLK